MTGGSQQARILRRTLRDGASIEAAAEADALGILDYCAGLRGIIPPWRADEVLQPMLVGGSRR